LAQIDEDEEDEEEEEEIFWNYNGFHMDGVLGFWG